MADNNSKWREIVARYQTPSVKRAVWQLVSTLVPLIAAGFLMYWSLSVSYWLTLALALPAAGLAIRTFIIMHDCGHGSFLPSRTWNDIVGWVTGILTATPYSHWRREHAIHHATSGHLEQRGTGDITTLTVREYLSLKWARRAKYRIYRNPLILLGFGPAFLLIKHRWPSRDLAGKREIINVHGTNLALAAMITILSLLIGFREFMLIWLPVVLISGTIGVWLFYVQHQFEDAYWRDSEDWDYATAAVAGSSYFRLPKVLQWFTGNIGFHHVHHLSPKIPNYQLERCHRENPTFQKVTTLTLWQSIRTLGLKLWDEESGRMVGFRHLRRLRRGQRSK
ncbi:MAG TPA: fatty acid desaturase [Gemmatimonadales bacterium]|jgi:omega-6 fatty acid desaturase (delta-12 desaturase)|nr:fatty acid desaturase [Gemmatimonadales bacterium]